MDLGDLMFWSWELRKRKLYMNSSVGYSKMPDISRRRQLLSETLENRSDLPLISLIMPVYNPPIEYFRQAIESVLQQIYPYWELCIADDASTDPAVWPFIENVARNDDRIKIVRRDNNGHISKATNTAAELAEGEFIAFFDQDDLLDPGCLVHLAHYIAKHSDLDIIFSDDDKIDIDNKAYEPQYKQGYDPCQLLSFMAFGHIFCVRRSLFKELGGFRVGFEGAQDYDFALRASERARRVGHVPVITYHWRSVPGSTAAGGGEKLYSFEAGRRAVEEALIRRGIEGEATHPDWAKQAGCGLFGIRFPDDGEWVTVILPVIGKDGVQSDALRLLNKTKYRNVNFLIISEDDIAIELPSRKFSCLKVERASRSEMCNIGAEVAKTPWICFLSPLLAPHCPSWLSSMVGWARIEGGSVGGKIYSADGRILHAGYLHGLERVGLPGRVGFGSKDSWGHHFRLVTAASCDAVSETCLLISKQQFHKLGGFDHSAFPDVLSGADLGYRIRRSGRRNVFCPDARFTCLANEGYYDKKHSAAERLFSIRYRSLERSVNPNIAMGADFAGRRFAIAYEVDRPLRVLMVSHGLGYEGAPKSFQNLCTGLFDRGKIVPMVWAHVDGPLRHIFARRMIDVEVLSSIAGCNDRMEGSDLDKYVVENLSFLGIESEASFLRTIESLAKKMRESGAEVVVANTVLAFWAILAADREGIPSIWIIRESEKPLTHFRGLPSYVQDAARKCFSLPYRVVFVSHATKEIYEKFDGRENFTVIHNALPPGIDKNAGREDGQNIRKELGIADEEHLVLMLGTVFERKGQIDLIMACKEMSDEVINKAVFLIVGDRPGTRYSKLIHNAINLLPESRRRRIYIIPETDSPEKYYKAANSFVCCSRFESYPRVILEAMVYELPIITTPVFGIKEQVEDGRSALFYEPGDVHKLRMCLEAVICDGELRKRLMDGVRSDRQHLPSYDAMLCAYESIIDEAVFS